MTDLSASEERDALARALKRAGFYTDEDAARSASSVVLVMLDRDGWRVARRLPPR